MADEEEKKFFEMHSEIEIEVREMEKGSKERFEKIKASLNDLNSIITEICVNLSITGEREKLILDLRESIERTIKQMEESNTERSGVIIAMWNVFDGMLKNGCSSSSADGSSEGQGSFKESFAGEKGKKILEMHSNLQEIVQKAREESQRLIKYINTLFNLLNLDEDWKVDGWNCEIEPTSGEESDVEVEASDYSHDDYEDEQDSDCDENDYSHDDYEDEQDSDSDENTEGPEAAVHEEMHDDQSNDFEKAKDTGDGNEAVGSPSGGSKTNNNDLMDTDEERSKSVEKWRGINRFMHYTEPGLMCVKVLDEKISRVRSNDSRECLMPKLHQSRHIYQRKNEEFNEQNNGKMLNMMQKGNTQLKEAGVTFKLLLNRIDRLEDEISIVQVNLNILSKMKLNAILKFNHCLKSELGPRKLLNEKVLGLNERLKAKIIGLPELGGYESTGEALLTEDLMKGKLGNSEGKLPAKGMQINLPDSDKAANDKKMVKGVASKGKYPKEQKGLGGSKILLPIVSLIAGALAAVILLFVQSQEN